MSTPRKRMSKATAAILTNGKASTIKEARKQSGNSNGFMEALTTHSTTGTTIAPLYVTQSDVAMGLTQLSPRTLVAMIPGSKEDEYLGTDVIEIDCSGRRSHTTPEERQLLEANGYVELFDYLVVGWDMWVRADQAATSVFFSGKTLPISHRDPAQAKELA